MHTSENAGTKTEYTYDVLNRLVKAVVCELSGEEMHTENYAYNAYANDYEVVKTTVSANGNQTATLKQHYDNSDNMIKKEYIDDEKTYTKNYTYDYMGKPLTEQDANGNTVTYSYDWRGNVLSITDAAGNMSEIEYDLAGRQIKATDANGSTAETVYDELDRAIIPKTPFEGTQKAVSKQYYDSNSNTVKKMVQNNVQGEAESYAVTDNMGNLLGEIGRNAGQDSVVQYTYDTGDA